MSWLFLAALLAAAPAPQNAQQAYEAAETLRAQGDKAGALAAYEALAKTVGSTTRALLLVREGEVLIDLDREEEARTRLREGLAGLGKDSPTTRVMRFDGHLALARSEELGFDLESAASDYRAAYASAVEPMDKLAALVGAVRTGMFIDPPAAVRDAEAAIALAATEKDQSPARHASFLTLQGRALLNAGRPAEAEQVLAQATTLLGGLTRAVDQQDIRTRSDVAIAALRANHLDNARKYMAYTGAGQLRDGNFTIGADMQPPACGEGPDDPHREDVVVIELSVADDGSVTSVTPIFASRPGMMIARFATAVKNWSWRPDQLAKIKPFFRSGVRLEMRCSTKLERVDAVNLLRPAFDEWAASKGLPPAPPASSSAVAALAALRAELARREAADGASAPALLPILAELIVSPVADHDEIYRMASLGAAIATQADAPIEAVTWYRMLAANNAPNLWTSNRSHPAQAMRAMSALADEPAVSANPRAAAAVRLSAAEQAKTAHDDGGAQALLRAVADDGRLGAHDPLKVGALVRLSSLRATSGDMIGAQQLFERSGLDVAQCALVDAKPAPTRQALNSVSYPMEALAWGFEGWVRMEFDVTAEGKTSGVRATVAYPPFVFSQATVKDFSRAHFEQSYRPGGTLGCSSMNINVNFGRPY